MLTDYSLKMPRNVLAGEHALEDIKDVIPESTNKIVIFTDKGIIKAGLVNLVEEVLNNLGLNYKIVSDIPAEPTYHQVQEVVDQFKAEKADFIVAIGGGSAMDTAKLASILSTDDYGVKDLLDNPLLAKNKFLVY